MMPSYRNMNFILVLVIFMTFDSILTSGDPSVTLPLGKINGYTKKSANGRIFNAFEGIPYARPPVGENRFKEAASVEPWMGIWEAKTMFKCIQYNHLTPPEQDMVVGDEDCLYVNIYTPAEELTKQLDVLVYIHGGAFMFLYGGNYGPEIVMDRDIIYVNLNYRLGPLGFLSTEDDVVPGNNGLKDQILALKWIKENIRHFGGNPNSITIFGMSAGGASVHFHYLLPQSKGLFQRGISQSGAVLDPWVLVERSMDKTKKLSSIVGCPVENSIEIVNCLKSKPAKQIVDAVKHFQPWLYNPFTPFGPVVDTWAKNPLLSEHPLRLLQNKKVEDLPWIISYVSGEGLYPGADFYPKEHLEYIDKQWNAIMPYILHYNDVVSPENMDYVSEKIRKEYLKDEKLTQETFHLLIQAMSDRLFSADIERSARLHAAAIKSPVYSYYFDYRGAHSCTEASANTDIDIGVSHADDTAYILKGQLETRTTKEDRRMSDFLVDIVVYFMNNGQPNATVEWEPLSKLLSDPWVQLRISNPDNIYMETVKEVGNKQFWDSLPLEENERLLKIKDEL